MKKISPLIQYLTYIIVLVIFILTLRKCEEDKYNILDGQYTELQKYYNIKTDSIKILKEKRIIEKDSLVLIIKQKEYFNQQLDLKNKDLESKIVDIKSKKIEVPLDIPGLVNYFNTRYNNDNIIVEGRVGLSNKTGYEVSYELEEKDKMEEILSLKDFQLINKDSQIFNLQENSIALNRILITTERELREREELQDITNKNTEILEKQIKSLKRKNLYNKILIPTVFILGGFVGHQLIK